MNNNQLLKLIAENIYREEESFFITIHADELDLPLEGLQRLVMGGRATPNLRIIDDGIEVSLSINRIHYDIFIPWDYVTAVEGSGKAFYCKRNLESKDAETKKIDREKRKTHLKVVK